MTLRCISTPFAALLLAGLLGAPDPAAGQSSASPCRAPTARTRTTLQEFRNVAWKPGPSYQGWRELMRMPTLRDSAAADTAIMLVMDPEVCRRVVAKYGMLRGDSVITAASVVRYGKQYIVFEPVPDTIRDTRRNIAMVLDSAFFLHERFFFGPPLPPERPGLPRMTRQDDRQWRPGNDEPFGGGRQGGFGGRNEPYVP